MAMLTARQKVVAYLHKYRSGSAREIARALNMAIPAVRHHLRVLASDGRLEVTAVPQRDRRGPPEKRYSLPRAALGDNLAGLAAALLVEMGRWLSPETLAGHMVRKTDSGDKLLPRRLAQTVEELNRMHYHARWEAGAAGPRIIFGHCPYAAIIEKHPELCQMDAALLQQLMGQPAEQYSKIGRDGSSVCVFLVGRR